MTVACEMCHWSSKWHPVTPASSGLSSANSEAKAAMSEDGGSFWATFGGGGSDGAPQAGAFVNPLLRGKAISTKHPCQT